MHFPRLMLSIVLGCSLVILVAANVYPQQPSGPSQMAPAPSSPLPSQSVHATGDSARLAAAPVSAVVSSTAAVEPHTIAAQVVSKGLIGTQRVSLGMDGEGDDATLDVAMTADGRLVAFSTRAGNLIPNDHNGVEDIYLTDLESGETQLLSHNADGEPGNGWSGGPALSANGRFVAFFSWAGNLVDGDTNAVQDVFVKDRQSGSVLRVSVATDGAQASDRSGDNTPGSRPAISADGRYVAYHSLAANLVEGDVNGVEDVFVHDLVSRRTTRISALGDGVGGNGASLHPALSADGRHVVYESRATNLASGTRSAVRAGTEQIYMHDRQSGETTLISKNLMGLPGNRASTKPAISGDGRFVVFQSLASDLVGGDTNGASDIFLYNTLSDEMSRVSVPSTGAQSNEDSATPVISLDGRHIAYLSGASNLAGADSNDATDIFVYDRLSRYTSRVSLGVVAPWTGEQANGDSVGPPALTAGGRLVAFVSAATNLVADDHNGKADLFVHERVDPPTYVVSGRVVDISGRPLNGAKIMLGVHNTVTNPSGRYSIPNVVGGTYTLIAAKSGYTFSPARRTISVLSDVVEQNFAGYADGGSALAFLNLPLGRASSPIAFAQALRDTEDGGQIDAWFDHDLPDYSKNQTVALWDGRGRTAGSYNLVLGCYERRCYDGHDGVDFPYRDPVPETPELYEPLSIYPAAAGVVVAEYTTCSGVDRWCNDGYGNEVIVDHGNGFLTRYSHLARIDVLHTDDAAPYVLPVDVLGIMGSTGNSQGTHLHFSVHRDNGNHQWDGADVDRPVDPFGWAGAQPDPWVLSGQGPVSRWLWLFSPNREFTLFGNDGARVEDATGAVAAEIPAGAFRGQATLELAQGAPAGPSEGFQRSLGRAFRLHVLQWVPDGAPSGGADTGQATEEAVLAQPVVFDVDFAGIDTQHLDLNRILLHRWDNSARQWLPLPTQVDLEARTVRATSAQLGSFDLQAPLLCADDAQETDDSYYTATFVQATGTPIRRLFDVAGDEDWLRLEAVGGRTYRIMVTESAEGVDPRVELYDVDGLTPLASDGGHAEGSKAQLSWRPVRDGTYFIRLAPAPGSTVGCAATYSLVIE